MREFRELREEEAPQEVYEAMRRATRARIRRHRAVRYVLAAAALLLLASAVTLMLPRRVEPPVITRIALPVEKVQPVEARKPVVARVRKPKPAPPPPPPEPMKLVFATDDPDIVIIWLVGEEGDL